MSLEFIPERILEEKTVDNKRVYLVKFEGRTSRHAEWQSQEVIAAHPSTNFDELYAEFVQSQESPRVRARRTSRSPARRKVVEEEKPKSPARRRSTSVGRRRKADEEVEVVAAPAVAAAAASVASPTASKAAARVASPAKAAEAPVAAAPAPVVLSSSMSTFVPVGFMLLWLSGMVNLGFTLTWKPDADAYSFVQYGSIKLDSLLGGSFLCHLVASAAVLQWSLENAASRRAYAAAFAANWTALVNALLTFAALGALHYRGFCMCHDSGLHTLFLKIAFGYSLHNLAVYGWAGSYDIYKKARVLLEIILYSAVFFCPVDEVKKNELLSYIFFLFLVFRVAEFFLSSARLCPHVASSSFMYFASVLSLYGGMLYFLVSTPNTANKLAVFTSFFFGFFLSLEPKTLAH